MVWCLAPRIFFLLYMFLNSIALYSDRFGVYFWTQRPAGMTETFLVVFSFSSELPHPCTMIASVHIVSSSLFTNCHICMHYICESGIHKWNSFANTSKDGENIAGSTISNEVSRLSGNCFFTARNNSRYFVLQQVWRVCHVVSTPCIPVHVEKFPNWCLELSPVVILEEFVQSVHECPIAKRFESCKWNPVEQTIMPVRRLVTEIYWAAGAWQLDVPQWSDVRR
jgi:hypothetical protein